nr:ORF1 [Torque teno Leptonychotes weddellii virus 2]
MARFFRRWRRPRRRYHRRYWRHFPRWRHWRRRKHWRRRHFRSRPAAVRYYPAKRHKKLVVSGFEFLGNVCSTTTAKDEAKPYELLDLVDVSDAQKLTQAAMKLGSQWQGSWGHHYFSFRQLLTRAQYYFNTFSTDWRTYDYIQFLGGYIWLPRQYYLDWMFYIDYDLQDKMTSEMMEDKYSNSKTWFHPGIFMNRRGAVIVGSPHRFGLKTMFRRLKVRPPASWEGLYNLPTAMDYIFLHWAWTWVDLEQSFMDSFCVKAAKPEAKPCERVPWWMGGIESMPPKTKTGDRRAAWVDREKYCLKHPHSRQCDTTVGEGFEKWGPFCPSNYGFPYTSARSLWFKYKFYFKLSGDSVYRGTPTNSNQDLVPPAPEPEVTCSQRKVPPHSILKRPLTPSDILPGDLDSDGILKDGALERIIGSHRGRQPTVLVPKRVRFRIDKRQRQHRVRKLLRSLME